MKKKTTPMPPRIMKMEDKAPVKPKKKTAGRKPAGRPMFGKKKKDDY